MASYALTIKPSAGKELDALDTGLFTRIDRKIHALANNSRTAGCRKLQGYSDWWRIRVGDYRVIYAIDDSGRTVGIIRVAHRREVYEA